MKLAAQYVAGARRYYRAVLCGAALCGAALCGAVGGISTSGEAEDGKGDESQHPANQIMDLKYLIHLFTSVRRPPLVLQATLGVAGHSSSPQLLCLISLNIARST